MKGEPAVIVEALNVSWKESGVVALSRQMEFACRRPDRSCHDGVFRPQVRPVSGVVVNKSGLPIVDAVVTLAGQSVHTDEKGAFSFKEVRNGTHTVKIDIEGYEVTQQIVVKQNSGPVEIVIPEINWALGKSYTYNIEPSETYEDSGGELTDGERANSFYKNPPWSGHLRQDYREIIIDLEKVRPIAAIKTAFLRDSDVGIGLPPYVSFSVSLDGEEWEEVGDMDLAEVEIPSNPWIQHVEVEGLEVEGRYVKLYFEVEVWAFLDEIEVWG